MVSRRGRGRWSRLAGWAICSPSSWSPSVRRCSIVPATLASRVRVLGTGQSTKTDPNDARSVAVAALRAPSLAVVRPADHVIGVPAAGQAS